MTDGGANAAPRANWRGLAWALLPPVAVLLLRAALQAQTDEATVSLNAVHAATVVREPGEAIWAALQPFLWTFGSAVVVIAATGVWIRRGVRRHGWARTRPRVIGVWVVLCVAAAGGLLAQHLNRSGRQPQPARQGDVLLVREVRPSERSVGGAEVYLQLPGDATPLHLLAEGQPATRFPPKSTVRLQTERGRWWGRWGTVTPLALPASPASPASATPPAAGNG